MDFRVMSAIAAATTVERLTSNGERSARAIGGVLVGAGLLLTARALIAV